MRIELSEDLQPFVVVLSYAAILHFLYWVRNRQRWAARLVDWLGRVTRQGEQVVLIWAFVADMLAVVFFLYWLRATGP